MGQTLSPLQLACLCAHMQLDRSWRVQYINWLGRFLRGDFGVTLQGRTCVRFLVIPGFRRTLTLIPISIAASMSAAFALGVLFSSRAGSKPDLAVASFALFMASVPPLAVLLVLQLFAFRTGLFPVSDLPARSMAPNVFAFANFIFIFDQFQHMAKMITLDQIG